MISAKEYPFFMNSGTPLEASCQDAFADKSLTKDFREWVDPFMSWMD